MAQSVERLTPDFGSGCDLTVREIGPQVGLRADGVGPARDSLSPAVCPFPARVHTLSLSLKINK